MNPFNILQYRKKQPYKKTNYDNIHAHYADYKYIRMKPKSCITLTPGFIFMIIKHPKEWVQLNFCKNHQMFQLDFVLLLLLQLDK